MPIVPANVTKMRKAAVVYCFVFVGVSMNACLPIGLRTTTSQNLQPSREESIKRAKAEPDQDAILEFKVTLKVTPTTPTTYERTLIGTDTVIPLEFVEVVDETRGIKGKPFSRDRNLESLFGPKNGLTEHITVRATVRVRGQPGEKIIRRTILLRNVPPDIWTKAEVKGSIRVVVQLDVPTRPEASLNHAAMLAQREAIELAQENFLAAMDGTEYNLVRHFDVIPGCALEVTPKALAVLDRLPNIIKVAEDHSHIIRIP